MRARFSIPVCLCVLLGFFLSGWAGAADSGLVAWWRFDEGSGTVARDASGNGNHGTLVGADWFEGGWNGAGGCLEFIYGQADRVAIENNMDVIGAGITITAWMNPYSFRQHDCRVVSKSSTAATADGHWWMLGTNNSVNLRFRLKTDENATTLTLIDTAGAVVTGEWQFIAAMWDGAVATTHLDAVETGRANKGGTAVAVDSGVPVAIGNQPAAAADGERAFDGLIDDVRIYNRALTTDELAEVMQGAGPGTSTELATVPVPADGATDVPRDVALGWMPGDFASTHDVYLGTVLDDVTAADRANPMGVLVSQGQAQTIYDPAGVLGFETTYFWRVDEVNAAPDNTVFKGTVWSFTSEPLAYPIADVVAASNGISDEGGRPENTVNGSGLNAAGEHSIVLEDMWLASPDGGEPLWIEFEFDRVYRLHEMWVWNYNVQFEPVVGFGLKGVTVEYSADGVDWMSLGNVEFARATGRANYTHNTTVDFGGATARYVRLTVGSGHGMLGQYGLSEVRFLYVPVQAREPQPADGAANVDPDVVLIWRGGREAAMHELYFGTDEAAVADGTASVDAVAPSRYDLGALDLGTTYHWKVDEVNDAETPDVWAGDVWTFSTKEFVAIEGFDDYTDDIDAGEAIFQTWIDGWENGTGSVVGYADAPFAERAIVHGGSQSMPFHYDNAASPWYSEASRTFETAQDWTVNGADTLELFVYGNPPAFVETAAGSIIMGALGTDIWGTADQFRFAYKRLSGDGSIVARVDSVFQINEWSKGGVMIRESLEVGSTHALVAVTPVNGVAFQYRARSNDASTNANQTGLAAPYWVKLTRTGNTLTAEHSADGATWAPVTTAAASTTTISMIGDVYIGLALTSHEAAVATSAEFSNVTMTGNVTGQWQTAAIGVAQPAGNSPEPLYVAVEDTGGRIKAVTHPSLSITATPAWQRWSIPLSEFSSAGVRLNSVEAMYIGVGNRDNPTAGGSGLIYLDDIRFGHPASAQ